MRRTLTYNGSMKQTAPADTSRTGQRVHTSPLVPLCADAFTLPAPRLRDLTRAELAARSEAGEAPARAAGISANGSNAGEP